MWAGRPPAPVDSLNSWQKFLHLTSPPPCPPVSRSLPLLLQSVLTKGQLLTLSCSSWGFSSREPGPRAAGPLVHPGTHKPFVGTLCSSSGVHCQDGRPIQLPTPGKSDPYPSQASDRGSAIALPFPGAISEQPGPSAPTPKAFVPPSLPLCLVSFCRGASFPGSLILPTLCPVSVIPPIRHS